MVTKIVYALTSDENDVFLEQVILSAYSLKKYNSKANVTLVVDSITNQNLKDDRANYKKYIDKTIVAVTPTDLTKRDRSRWLKTQIRELVVGDYLFIDSDTVITSELSNIDNCEYDVCAVLDRHVTLTENQRFNLIKKQFESFGWEPTSQDEKYFNSGVMYVKDSLISHQLYKLWYHYWDDSRKRGLNIDQPALAKANAELGYVIKELSGEWNCQILGNGLTYLSQAKIIHFYNTASRGGLRNCPYKLSDNQVFMRIKKNKYLLDKQDINNIEKSKTLFATKYDIISDAKLNIYYSSPVLFIYEIYQYHPRFYSIVNKLVHLYNKLKRH